MRPAAAAASFLDALGAVVGAAAGISPVCGNFSSCGADGPDGHLFDEGSDRRTDGGMAGGEYVGGLVVVVRFGRGSNCGTVAGVALAVAVASSAADMVIVLSAPFEVWGTPI